ncbi:MAG TPA: hypothetical protein VGR28_04570 [Candidatus Thermoplasmatota archaeon]|nr:hypothetical protein [Candidatus Thermoplasmatota archaeon]
MTLNDVDKVLVVVRRFQTVARQLQARKKGREGQTIVLNDEYDVQDLLHGLLKMFFDDVRPEEWTPAYAGGAARMDFLLKKERTVVEVKKTRSGLGEKEVGDQLIQDIVKYGEHKDCGTLVCFVYDPEARIGNPRGLEADLSKMSTEKLTVIVVVAPG